MLGLAWLGQKQKGFLSSSQIIQMHSLPPLPSQPTKEKKEKEKKKKEKEGTYAKKKARLGFVPLLE